MGALGDPRVVSHWLSCFEAASSQFAVEDRSIPDVRETMGHRLRPRAVVPGAISCTEYRVCQRARSVSRVLYRSTPKRHPVMVIHLRPPVARRLMRPTRGLGSAPLLRPVARHGLRPPIWPCSGWSLPVSLRHRPEGRRRHRHCGTGPRLATDGCYPPPCAVELGLSSRPPMRVTPIGVARPSDRLADWAILRRSGSTTGRGHPMASNRRGLLS